MSDSNNDPSVIGLVTAGLPRSRTRSPALPGPARHPEQRLPNEYVPRREIERRMDEMTIDIGAERAAREAAFKAVADQNDNAKAERANQRRWIVGLAVTSAISTVGVVSGIALHFS
jgi:LmbE family N-acetylglucosaminyl deacetylase